MHENQDQNKNHKPDPHLTQPSINPKPPLYIYKTEAAFGVTPKFQPGMGHQQSLPRLSSSRWGNVLPVLQNKQEKKASGPKSRDYFQCLHSPKVENYLLKSATRITSLFFSG